MGALCAPEWGRLGFGMKKKRTPTEVGVQDVSDGWFTPSN